MSDPAERGIGKELSSSEAGPVLLCFDGSDHAAEAVRRAARLLRTRSAIVVHVTRERSGEAVAETGRELAVAAGFDPVSVVVSPHPHHQEAILTEARRVRASVIAVGSRGRSAAEASLLGSVSSAIVHHADLPVLVVRPGAASSDEAPVTPVQICYDGSDASRYAILAAGELVGERDAVIASFIEQVDDVVVLRSKLPWSLGEELEDRLAQVDRMEATGPLQRAEEGVELARNAGFAPQPQPVSGEGPAWARLLEAAAATDAACIVVGHRPTAERLGSTTYGLVHHAERPVLVVPAAPDSRS
jgi:nucleotide-binding universal stress UspA family protein